MSRWGDIASCDDGTVEHVCVEMWIKCAGGVSRKEPAKPPGSFGGVDRRGGLSARAGSWAGRAWAGRAWSRGDEAEAARLWTLACAETSEPGAGEPRGAGAGELRHSGLWCREWMRGCLEAETTPRRLL